MGKSIYESWLLHLVTMLLAGGFEFFGSHASEVLIEVASHRFFVAAAEHGGYDAEAIAID